ncbi:CHASE3 domain-containing protein [Kutzneria sp. CA-103260]|uniref:CHASE3 domain-containing protein n=1 Tax=Kutzneria sp. CA-103260 TaxID=2802641 RepID=UPI001BA98443|nr:CHASE3 domain-containing protein [Kutzneria sp. CA-103260]QUQ68783.1 CHASE3 domain protein [Kutzneria sp. CA-103260]
MGGLILRVLGACALLTITEGVLLVVLLSAVVVERESAQLARHSQELLTSSSRLERLLVDVETGGRGFLLTGDESFLEPWNTARAAIPAESANLQRLSDTLEQKGQSRRITQGIESYIARYSVPMVDAARRNDPLVRSVAAIEEGRRRVDPIRIDFERLDLTERGVAVVRDEQAEATARQAVVAVAAGVAGSLVLILLFAGYMTRAVIRPVRRAAAMADRLAGGELTTRIPETGAAEIRTLERSFNKMGRSLEQNRDELTRFADEQAALRRVATLVAHAEPPPAVFTAVTEEAGRVLGADGTRLLRYEADGTATVVASWGAAGSEVLVGARVTLDAGGVASQVLRTDEPARIEGVAVALGGDVRSAVGVPILVEGALWGVMKALSTRDEPLPEDTENRFANFTDLIATAIANTQARADLAASRARVVAAADQTRRRIERDLHDGIQQRLVSLALDVRTIEAGTPAELPGLLAELSEVAAGLAAAVDELREISRGIHPAILSEGGLGPALRALARRSAIPVELDVRVESRLAPPVEVAAYYTVAEALANAAKHARASVVRVEAAVREGRLFVSVRDDGVGSADPARGSGLIGLTDRIEALEGRMTVASPPGLGTSLQVELPVSVDE